MTDTTERANVEGERRTATDPRWTADPSPSWDAIAPCDTPFHLDTPDDPSGDMLAQTEKLWPNVHPAIQEARPHA